MKVGKKREKGGMMGWKCWLAIFFFYNRKNIRERVKAKPFKLRLKSLSWETGNPWEGSDSKEGENMQKMLGFGLCHNCFLLPR